MNIVYWDIGVDAPITPTEPLPPLPDIPAGTAVILTGRAPIWRYGMAFHAVHGVAQVVAVYDPRLAGGVVVASHKAGLKEGDIIA